jgi:hypothetical protein
MGALFVRDIWPAWTAQDAPPMRPAQLAKLDRPQQQFQIIGPHDRRMGTAWSNVVSNTENTTIYGTLVLETVPLVPAVLIETVTDFDTQGGMDSFSLDVFGVPMMKIQVRGERRGIYFPCEARIGPLERQANLDLSASRLIGETLRPFTFLPTLRVGQRWRMQLLDAASIVAKQRAEFTSIVAEVTGTEVIRSPLYNEPVECFVVETSPQHAKAWVGPKGDVLVQEVDVPGLGKLTIREETFNSEERTNAKQRIRSRPGLNTD